MMFRANRSATGDSGSRFAWVVLGVVILVGWLWPLGVWARPVLQVSMRLGQSVNPKFWYLIALSKEASPGPTANLLNPNVSLGGQEVAFLRDWDYLIRIKPLNDESLLQASIQAAGQSEQEFVQGFNELNLRQSRRPRDTINAVIDLSTLANLDPVNQDIHVALLTVRDPITLAPEATNLAIDATRGDSPNYYKLSLSDRKEVKVEDPQQQETIRRSRELINLDPTTENIGATSSNLEGGNLEILAANIVTFTFVLEDR